MLFTHRRFTIVVLKKIFQMFKYIWRFGVFFAATILVVSSCSSDAPKMTPGEVESYNKSIEGSGSGWPHWFPRPSWYPRSSDGNDRPVESRVINAIAACSGGVTISNSQARGVAREISGRFKDGNISFQETKDSVIGINFGDKQITADTVDLYSKFVGCITSEINRGSSCESRCESTFRSELKSIFNEYASCMDESVLKCERSCERKYGLDPDECTHNYCNKASSNNLANWSTGNCNSVSDVDDLQQRQTSCISSCN